MSENADGISAQHYVALTAEIVSAFAANNSVSAEHMPELIKAVHGALSGLGEVQEAPLEPLVPAVPIKKSITPDAIICLEDGRKLKMLKRHLRTSYDMSPEEYRARWGLASDYPMVAPNYAAERSSLAKKIGLGKKSTKKRK
jgi:predicted transcriptional regulator